VVLAGREDEAVAAQAALGAAGIEAVSMANNSYLPGVVNLLTTVEVAVPRRYALEAAHILRVLPPPEEEDEEDPRTGRIGMAAVAVMIIICLLLLAAFVLLPRPWAG
jgi:hypothetical protein